MDQLQEPKDIDETYGGREDENICMDAPSLNHITLFNPLNCIELFYIARLIMFSLWLTIVMIF